MVYIAAVQGSRGIVDPDPPRIQRARERRRLTRARLALQIEQRLRRHAFTSRAVQKVETGVPVEGARFWPILIELGLAEPPSLERPSPGQAPGQWVRALRESYGIAPTLMWLHAFYPDSARRLSRTTLAQIEAGKRLPGFPMLDALVAAFTACGVPVTIEHLEEAWIREGGPELAAVWGPEIERARRLFLAQDERTARIRGLAAALGTFSAALAEAGSVKSRQQPKS